MLNHYQRSDIAYCSNVHPGESLVELADNLETFISKVQQQRTLTSSTSGLWISGTAAAELQDSHRRDWFKQRLHNSGTQLTSLNGFPIGGFHDHSLKQNVYLPDWSQPERLHYTRQLATILADCLPDNETTGVISTVPLGYKKDWNTSKQVQAVSHLYALTEHLQALEQTTGKRILIGLEMEPDCVLETTGELIAFFQRLHSSADSTIAVARYLGCCFDVCHQAVLFEDIGAALQRITTAGIEIGKIQLSSALEVQLTAQPQPELLTLLQSLCEPRYLHQVSIYNAESERSLCADLPLALSHIANQPSADSQIWRIHFHTPLHFNHLVHPALRTTAAQLQPVFAFLATHPQIRPYLEVETYSWQVLPESVRPDSNQALINGITQELDWVEQQMISHNLLSTNSRHHRTSNDHYQEDLCL